MTGRPLLQTLAQRIEALGDDNMSGEDVLFARIADGDPIRKIADEMGVSRQYLYVWRDMQGHKERRREMWDAAVHASADAKAEEGEHILDTLGAGGGLVTPADVALARARAEYKMRLAAVRDRETYGERQQPVNVNVTVQTLHLDALRIAGQPRQAVAERVLEAELLPAEMGKVEDGESW